MAAFRNTHQGFCKSALGFIVISAVKMGGFTARPMFYCSILNYLYVEKAYIKYFSYMMCSVVYFKCNPQL